MFGLLCLKQIFSFYIPQPFHLKKKKAKTLLCPHLSILSCLISLLSFFLFVWLFDDVLAAGSEHLIEMYSMFSNHPLKRAVWFESSQPARKLQPVQLGGDRRLTGERRWCWWKQAEHNSHTDVKQAAESFPDARLQPSLQTSSGIRKAHLQIKQGTSVHK